jgi:DNA repair exonuclease SbcCD nuclease subunit
MKPRNAKIPQHPKGKERRFLWLSDLHIPFHNDKAILEAVSRGIVDKVDTVILGGDILDCHSLSTFTQYEAVPIHEEFRQARKLLDWISREFPKVIVLSGNHEDRERKHFYRKLTVDEADWLLSKSLMQRVTEDMPNVELVKRPAFDQTMTWLYPIGDAIVGHAESISSIPNRAVQIFKEWVTNWREVLDLPRPRLIIMGHTHQSSMAWIGDTMCVESGCLCKIQGYALDPKLKYRRPQRLGYVRFDQYDGKTDMANIKLHFPFVNERRANG